MNRISSASDGEPADYSQSRPRPYPQPYCTPPADRHKNINLQLATHVHHFSSDPNTLLTPVDPSKRLSSSPSQLEHYLNDDFEGGQGQIRTGTGHNPEISDQNFIRTPPPTDRLVGKGWGRSAETVLDTPTIGRPQAMSSPDKQQTPRRTIFPTNPQDVSPQMFSGFQFSPSTADIFDYNSNVPASAPTYPQDKLFWDQSFRPQPSNINDASLMNHPSLGIDAVDSSNWIPSDTSATQLAVGFAGNDVFQDSQAELSAFQMDTGEQHPNGASNPTAQTFDETFTTQSSQPSNLILSPSGGVDPSLLFGAPGQSSLHNPIRTSQYRAPDAGLQSLPQNDPNSISTIDTKNDTVSKSRPSVKRRATDTVIGKRNRDPPRLFGEQIRPDPKQQSLKGRTGHSGLKISGKPLRDGQLHAIKEDRSAEKTTTFALTIDENGRARAERRSISPSKRSRNGFRKSRERSYDESDSESSSSSDEDMVPVPSRTSSFSAAFGKRPQPRSSHFPDDLSMALQQTQSINRSRAEMAGFGSSPSLPTPKPRGLHSRNGSGSITFSEPSNVSNDGVISDDEMMDDESCDAQTALRQVIADRTQRRSSMNNPFATSNRPRSSQSSRKRQSLPSKYAARPTDSRHLGMIQTTGLSPTSLTDPDLTTPSTDQDSLSGGSTRCVCNIPESGGHLMIQCDSCTKWLHVKCVGLNRKNLPPVYVCINCAGASATVRGGRIRDPMRSSANLGSSPLARKSQDKRHVF